MRLPQPFDPEHQPITIKPTIITTNGSGRTAQVSRRKQLLELNEKALNGRLHRRVSWLAVGFPFGQATTFFMNWH
jgi:hypothetical protein